MIKEGNIKKHLECLGLKVKDKVTGRVGIITSISFDLYGCIQVVITPQCGETFGASWYDIIRVEVLDEKPILDLPNYDQGYISQGKKGCALKSLPN